MFIFSTIGLIVLVLFGAFLAFNGCVLFFAGAIFSDWGSKIAGLVIAALGVGAVYLALKMSPFQMTIQMVS